VLDFPFKSYRQLITDGPSTGRVGDCFRTAIGMCLGLPPTMVPHFVKDHPNTDWREETRRWLNSRGLDLFEWPDFRSIDHILEDMCWNANDVPVMLSGWAERGDLHSIVIYRGEVYDPHPSDAGLCGPHPVRAGNARECYWIRIIAPRRTPAA
jgi:hypothetical protein